MSIGNLKDTGNQGNNFPWQWKMLQGLQAIADAVSGSSNVTIVNPLGQDTMANSLAVVLASDQEGAERTPNFLRPSGIFGNTPVGIFSVSFASVGTANATVGGMILKPGETLNLDAGAINNTLGVIAYDTTLAGAELIIIYLI
jgi:hypothetical protein